MNESGQNWKIAALSFSECVYLFLGDNMKDDITITKYDVSGGFLYSTFTLEYVKGRLCS